MATQELSKALYTLNKTAKYFRDGSRDGTVPSLQKKLYKVKVLVLKKLYETSEVEIEGYHVFSSNVRMLCLKSKDGFSFHISASELFPEKDFYFEDDYRAFKDLGNLDEISAEQKGGLDVEEAFSTICEYLGYQPISESFLKWI